MEVQPHRTLLNVEDYEPSRYRRTRLFRDAGYEVLEAPSARAALMTASLHSPSVALVDVHLPDGSGIALCETLKRLNPDMPVLLISALSTSETLQEEGLAAGALAYLGEPVPSDILLSRVAEALVGETAAVTSDPCIWTDLHGAILDVSDEGAALLSGTPRGLQHRNLLIYFEQDREAWRDVMLRANRGERIVRTGRLRPRERRPVTVKAEIRRAVDDMPPALVWRFRPES